ncbi:alpha/beta fold hydrolase [uncultured Kordia sp.]|uniref:YheT family hydrolase n=1 Tax=uncultured Kordia sp. TaxID=507699 RepID=UPI002617348A|nr:alpha/beta fold hydrolase [uncultured Kordia sp.]
MPIIKSHYNPPLIFKNGHFSTIHAGLYRKVSGVYHKRERITLHDQDFIDLDWSFAAYHKNVSKLIVILHGLEGNAQRAYIKGTAKIFNRNGYDAVAMNFRSCSGEPNRLYRAYNAGATEDLREVIEHILTNHSQYSHIILKGFSLGGNMLLKYLGEPIPVPTEIKAAIAVSAPCQLEGSLKQMRRVENYLYSRMFIKNLRKKLVDKHKSFPSLISLEDIKKANSMFLIDNLYTSKAHGFNDAADYYKKCSSKQFIPYIKIPTLLINAKNDSFLSKSCFPIEEAEQHENFYLEIPKYGGHVGFYNTGGVYYNEKRAFDFATLA